MATFPVTVAMMIFILAPLLGRLRFRSVIRPVVFPPRGFTMNRAPKCCGTPIFKHWVSSLLAVGATLGALLLCPAMRLRAMSFWAARRRDLARRWFPVLITGVALLQLFATMHSDNTPLNMLIAHVLVTMPYVVRTVAASLMLADTSLEDAARTLGAGRWRVFRRITVPQIAPGLAAGSLFAFMVSFDNFPISLWLADAQHNPIPRLVFQMIGNVFEPSIAAISTLMIHWRWSSSSR
jgi:putative spermidine/putrescine transport system permease protein